MASGNISAQTEVTAPAGGSLIYIGEVDGVTFVDRKATCTNFFASPQPLGATAPSTGVLTLATVSSATPTYVFKDTSCTDADVNASIVAAATDTATTAEDIDVTFSQQIAGTLTAFLTSDADGSITLGTGRGLVADGGGSLTGTWSDLGTITTADINGGTIDATTIGATTPAAATTTSMIVTSATPTYILKDSDCTDSDNNFTIVAAATDTGTGTEDIDVTFNQQIAGALTAFLTSDADGSITFGANRPLAVSGDIITLQAIGRDTDNEIAWTTDDQLDITIGGTTSGIVSISTGAADNDKLITQGHMDDAIGDVVAGTPVGGLSNVGDDTPTSGQILIADGDSWESEPISGDATLSAAGVLDVTMITNKTSLTGSIIFGDGGTSMSSGGDGDTIVGLGAGAALTNGFSCTAVGYNALATVTTSDNNTALGESTLQDATGAGNTAVGTKAMRETTSGDNNTAVGYNAVGGYATNTSNANTGVGAFCLYRVTSGSSNVALGQSALYSLTTGSTNVAIGSQAGRYITGGSVANQTTGTSVYIGGSTRASADGNANEIAIGNEVTGGGSNTVTIGNSSITDNYFTGNVRTPAQIMGGNTVNDIFLAADAISTSDSALVTAGYVNKLNIIQIDFVVPGAFMAGRSAGDDLLDLVNKHVFEWLLSAGVLISLRAILKFIDALGVADTEENADMISVITDWKTIKVKYPKV